jgi:hypothetical protein
MRVAAQLSPIRCSLDPQSLVKEPHGASQMPLTLCIAAVRHKRNAFPPSSTYQSAGLTFN